MCATVYASLAQSVPFPTGNRNFEAISPWGYTQTGTNWNTAPYLPFIYRDMWFRLMPPNGVTYNSNSNTFTNSVPGKLYPLILFFHGAGEVGTDNNKQLIHGGETHKNAVQSGRFPGFLLYPQNVSGGPAKAGALIEKLIATLPIDPNRIYVHGLSNGAKWAWDFMVEHPTLPAAMAPMSGIDSRIMDSTFLFKPMRLAQGGLDTNPDPLYTQEIVDWYNARGGNLEYFLFPNLGHGVWNSMYGRSDFFEWFLSKKTNTIHVLFTNEICPENPLVATLGVTPGFQDYEWRRGSQVIATGPTKSKIKVTEHGVYTVRLRNRGVWTDWSEPVEIKPKAVTNTPAIQVSGLRSKVLPAPDGSVATALELPTGYETYTWKNANDQVVGTDRIFTAATPGNYTAIVKEFFGCSSVPSPVFNVVSADGPNKPDAVNGFIGYATSQTTTKLIWTDNPTPVHNETGFEIYRSTSDNGGFQLIAITAANAQEYNDSGLLPNTPYYYILRPVNATSAGPVSSTINVVTQVDTEAPTAPLDLKVLSSASNSVTLSWNASTDNIGVYLYDIYVNGVKALAVDKSALTATVFGLTEGQVYNFTVKAKDVTGNVSPASNQVTAPAISNGLNYKYFEGTWSVLPNFNTLTPVKMGNSPNVDLSPRSRDTNFAFYWEGTINIPVAGNYTFETYSDDGSKLYIGGYSESNLVVNNDGSHGMQYREGTKNFPAPGSYPIVITYIQGGGGYGMNIYWKNTAHGVNSRQLIPNSAFVKNFTMPGSAPNAPTNLTATAASHNQINLTWSDNSNNETGFQLFRSTANEGPFTVVAVTGANTTSYSDTNLAANTKYFYRIQAIGQYGESGFSNEKIRGLNYSYYEQTMSNLNSLNSYTPVKTGISPNFDLSPRNRDANIAFQWVGKIKIPSSGNYTFYTRSDDGSTLFIDNVQVVFNDYNQGMTERSGVRNLSAGVHDIRVAYRNATGGFGLEVRYQGPGLSKQLIPNSALGDDEVNATTHVLPGPIPAPSGLAAQALDSKTVKVTWTDNSTNEVSFQLYRSVSSASNFTLYKTLPPNTVEYLDEGLFPRVTYYYRVDALNSTGTASPSNITNVSTPNSSPVFQFIPDTLKIRHGVQTDIQLSAIDADGDAVTLSGQSLPAFASVLDFGDGTGTLSMSPDETHNGIYNNVRLIAKDQYNGADTVSLVIIVNSNNNPVITGASSVTLNETYVTTLNLEATDADGEPISWSVNNKPAFVEANADGNTLQLVFNPGLNDSGTYSILVSASDGVGGVSTITIPLTVTNYNPNFTVSVNFGYASNAPAPWNNFMVSPVNFTGFTSQTLSALRDNNNNVTGIGLTVENPWQQAAQTGGVVPGLYPNTVTQSFFYHSNPVGRTVKVSGLNPNGTYNFKLLASRALNDNNNRTTRFTISGVSQTVNANMNTATVDFNGVVPNENGEVVVLIERTVTYALLNAIIIESVSTATEPPAAPSNLTAGINSSSLIQLSWNDNSGDETGFEIHKSTDNTNFTLLTTTTPDVTSYTDADFAVGELYYYKVRSINAAGVSSFTVTAQIEGPNRAPVLSAIAPISLVETETLSVPASATDADGDELTFSLNGAPGFVTLENAGNGNVVLELAPLSGSAGTYNFELVATDVHDASTSVPVSVVVSGQSEVRINFTNTTAANLAPSPWNNFTATGSNGTLTGLVNSSGANSGISIRTVSNWNVSGGGVNTAGPTNTGLYPNAVTGTSWFINTGDNTTRTIELTGLDPQKLYEFTFFAGRAGVADNRTARYTVGNKFVTLNASGNSANVAVMPGIKADATGKVSLVISKDAGATYAYIGSLVLRAYEDAGLPNQPLNLSALTLDRSSVKLTWTDASDNETGFEIWRSANSNGNYALVTTVAANSVTYTDAGLAAGTEYFYKIRSLNANGASPYSVEVSTSTFDFSVSINFNAFNGGPANWNNVSALLINPNMVVNNLYDENMANTGINMTVVDPFTGDNPWGMVTGNNSGVVPDRVMEGSLWTDPGIVATLRFTNLSFLKKYNFVFFGSRNASGNRTAIYTIGNTSVQLNAALNTNQTVQINGVVPEPDGSITVTMVTANGASFAYLNALIIQAVANPGGAARMASNARTVTPDAEEADESGYEEGSAQVYPNPFTDELNIRWSTPVKAGTTIKLINAMGIEVYSDVVTQDGTSELDLLLNDQLPGGVYFLRIQTGGKLITQRVIRK